MLKRFFPHFVKSNSWILFVILAGALSWSLTMVKSGLVYSYGMGFWGPNGHDGVWHIALINSLTRGSLEMPVFGGEGLRNYHIAFDLVLAGLSKITRIPSHNLYFQLLPPLVAVLIGLFTYRFVKRWTGSKHQALWATFFVYFSGSFGWLVTMFRTWEVGGESLFWSQQAISTLLNPPFAVSLLLLLLLCVLLGRYKGGFGLKLVVSLVVVLALIPQIKVYGGVLAFLGFGVLVVLGIFRKRFDYLVIFLFSVLLSAVLFFPLNKNASSLVVFQPFWFLETMMAISDRFYWPKFYEAMVTYKMADVWHKAIPAYGVAFLIFIVGNLGTRLLGCWEIVRKFRGIRDLREFGGIDVFLLSVASAGVVLPMLFLQKGTPWNTIQFFYYSLFVFSIYSGIFVGKWIENRSKFMLHISIYVTRVWLPVFVVVVLTLPSTYSTVNQYIPQRPPAKISQEELVALDFLKEQSGGVVLTYPFDRKAAEDAVANPPRPLYLYESTAYVSAFSQKSVFLEDEVNLDIMGYDWKTRRQEVLDWLDTLNEQKAYDFLRENNISYIYWIKGQRARVGEGQWGGTRIFENGEVEIYKVN